MEEKGHIVDSFRLAVFLVDAVVCDVVQGHLHVITFADIHKRWHQFWDLNIAVLLLFELSNCFSCALVHENRCIS